MDSHHATIVGRENVDERDFIILGHIENPSASKNSSEKGSNTGNST